jgi:hypothetical protein
MKVRISQRGKAYLETARTLLRVAQTMTDQAIAGQLKALADDYRIELRKLRMLMRPKHWHGRLLTLNANGVHDLMGTFTAHPAEEMLVKSGCPAPRALLDIRWRVRMRTFIFALVSIVPVSCVIDQAGAADRLPAFDIARNCSAETAGVAIGTGVEVCTKDETDAKNELAKRWSQFGASEKKFCVGESSTGGEQSYVELLTCLEMSTRQFSTRQQ